MIVWCSYCQKFLSEKPPFEEYSVSHSICAPCKKGFQYFDEDNKKRVLDLERFQKELHRLAEERQFPQALERIRRGLAKGIREVDILLSFLLPLLSQRRFGSESAEADLSQSLQEFRGHLIEALRENMQACHPQLRPEVLFVARGENPHNLGIHLLELWLCAEGIATRASEGSDEEILAEFKRLRPKVFGISISERSELPVCRALLQRVRAAAAIPPLFLAGGIAVRSGEISAHDFPEASLVVDHEKLFLTLKTHLALGFLYDLKLEHP